MRVALIFSLVLAVLAVIFALQNPDPVDVNFFGAAVQGSTALIVIVTFAIGVAVGVLATLPGWIRNRREAARLRKQIAGTGGSHPAAATPPPAAEPAPATRRDPDPDDSTLR